MARKVYICNINTSEIPKLSAEETVEILTKIKAGDEMAKDRFIYCNMRLVLSVAQRFGDTKENMDDIFQVGCVGLMKAIDNFDMSLNVKFSTYAVPMIIGEVKRFLRDGSSLRVSRSLRDTAYEVLKCRERLNKERSDEASLEEIANELNLSFFDVCDAIDAISEPVSLDDSLQSDTDETMLLGDHIADETQSCERWTERADLKEALKKLGHREKEILNLRYFIGKTQMEVSNSIGISQAQVSRLEKNALAEIKKFIQ